MKLRVSADSITIHIEENSSHYLHVSHVLTHILGQSFWVNETLINFVTPHNSQKRHAFLASLYYLCASIAKTHNASFLEKLLLASQKPIRLVKKKLKQHFRDTLIYQSNPYHLLHSNEKDSLAAIRHNYLALAKMFHPDKIRSDDETILKGSTAKFQQIQEAYVKIKAERTKKIAA